ncbi:MAG: hypothetical protein M3421_01430 [Bacteroidota bacterium]|nr:hypothetical protein [Bacteroidota bacterium]
MKNKVFKFKLHNKEIMMKISENGMFPLNVMIDQNQLINLLGMNFKDFLKSNEIIYFLENYKSQSPLFIVSEMDLENSKIKWINVLFVEMFDKE